MKYLFLLCVYLISIAGIIFANELQQVEPENCEIWGPGLGADKIVLPARYFYIQAYDKNKQK